MNTLYTALLYYSRLPAPKGVNITPEGLNRALMFFPLVGLVVGTLSWGAYYISARILPESVAMVVAICAAILCTGAMHEDGLADMCDGFGGGYSKEATLRIMKDSSIGTYGVIGLIITLLLRYTLLCSFEAESMAVVMITAHGASRFAPVLMVRTSTYARTEPSKSSHAALGISNSVVVVALLFAMLPTLLLGWQFMAIYSAVIATTFMLFRAYIYRKIEGFTGDTLGALQQISELLFYITLLGVQHL